MKNKSFILIGIVVIVCIVGIFFVNNKKGTSQNNQTQTNNSLFGKEFKVGNDVCGEFPKEWVAEAIGKQIIKTEEHSSSGTYVCQYYTDENNFITLRLNNLSVENQKKGQITLGRTITTNPKIKMEHFVVLQDNGLINGIYLVINPNLFIAVDRTSTKAASEDELTSFAIKVAERIQNGENVVSSQPTPTSQTSAPIPSGEDIVRNFFSLISEGKIADAINMMTPTAIGNDSQKQAWGVQFNAFKKINVKKIEPSLENTYKVILDIEMKPESANAPIPYYGYENGENFRWVGLEKIDNSWKITGIATGP